MTRPPSFVREPGFTLIELIIVLGLSSMLTVSLFSIHQAQRSQQLYDTAADRLKALNSAALKAMVETGEAPQTLSELLLYSEYPDAELSPWGEEIRLTGRSAQGLTLIMDYPDKQAAERIATLVSGSWSEQSSVYTQVHLPTSNLLRDNLLHRHADEDNPERNRMETHLDMNGFSVLGATDIEAQRLAADLIEVDEINSDSASVDYFYGKLIDSEHLYSDHIEAGSLVAQQVYIDNLETEVLSANTADINEVQTNYLRSDLAEVHTLTVSAGLSVEGTLTSHELTTSSMTADFITIQHQLSATEIEVTGSLDAGLIIAAHLQTVDLVSEQLEAGSLTSASAEFDELTASTLTVLNGVSAQHMAVDNLQATEIHAEDFITATTSLNQLEVELANYQQLWQQCIDAGGCQ